MGYSCHLASNRQAAIDANNTIDYALILMDSQMPQIDGLLATQLIRQAELKTGKHIPIIAMTASALQGDREKCLAAGMDDYISKPIDIEPLQKMIEKWLPQKPSNDANADADLQDSKKMAPSAGESSLLFDFKTIKELYKEHGKRLIALFTAEVPIQLARLRQACGNQNQKDLLDAAHGLKGLCTTITANSMAELCRELECLGVDENWHKAKLCQLRLEIEFVRLQTFLATAQAEP